MKKLLKFLTFWIPVKKWRQKAREALRLFFMRFIPLKKNWVIFYDTFSKNGNGDSIRPVAEELRRRRPDFKFFFVSKEMRSIDMADEVLILGTQRYEQVLMRAKYVVSPMDLPASKRQGQIWIMTWHGTPLKKIYLSREDTPEFRNYVKPFHNIDVFCNSSLEHGKIYEEALLVPSASIKNMGLPRNDILLQDSDNRIRNQVRKKLGIPDDKKVLFYCPTWRRYDWKMPMPLDLDKLKREIGNEYCILLRSHVGKHDWVDERGNKININDDGFTYDVRDYPNISELYLACDVLITDYSSSIFDFAITQKPQILFAYDLEDYRNEFKFYFDYENFVPGPIAKKTGELILHIANLKNYERKYGEQYQKFKETFCAYEDGHAAERVVDYILEEKHNG